MRKRAEERALEVYPIESHEFHDDRYRERNAFVKGYEQAEKDMIERACNYLYDHHQGNKDVYQFIGLFRLAMEEGL